MAELYTYVPDDYFEALASGSQHPEAQLLDIDFGSRYDGVTTAAVHDAPPAYLGPREEARYYRFDRDFASGLTGSYLSHQLAIYNGQSDYGPRFQLDQEQDYWQQTLDETVTPQAAAGHVGEDTVDLLRLAEDATSVRIYPTNGDVTFTGDFVVSAGTETGLASGAGDSEPNRTVKFTLVSEKRSSNARAALLDELSRNPSSQQIDHVRRARLGTPLAQEILELGEIVNAPFGLVMRSPSEYARQVREAATGIFWEAPKDGVLGTVAMLMHPIETAEGVYIAVTNPQATAQLLITDLGKTIELGSLREQGKVAGNVLMIFIPGPKFTEQFKKLSQAGKLTGKALDDVKELARGRARLVLVKAGTRELEDLGDAARINRAVTEKVLKEQDGIVRAKVAHRDLTPDFPVDEFGGTANTAGSRINKYQRNTRSVVGGLRTIENMEDFARKEGLEIPEYIQLVPIPGKSTLKKPTQKTKSITMMQYYRRQKKTEDLYETIYWHNLKAGTEDTLVGPSGKLHVLVVEGLLNNDEAFLHFLAHEVEEIRLVKEAFDNAGGGMAASSLGKLVNPETGGAYHTSAWRYADEFLETYRTKNAGN